MTLTANVCCSVGDSVPGDGPVNVAFFFFRYSDKVRYQFLNCRFSHMTSVISDNLERRLYIQIQLRLYLYFGMLFEDLHLSGFL
jgi:hypothetical protein